MSDHWTLHQSPSIRPLRCCARRNHRRLSGELPRIVERGTRRCTLTPPDDATVIMSQNVGVVRRRVLAMIAHRPRERNASGTFSPGTALTMFRRPSLERRTNSSPRIWGSAGQREGCK